MRLSPTQSSDSGIQSMIAEMPRSPSSNKGSRSRSKSPGKTQKKIIYIELDDTTEDDSDSSENNMIGGKGGGKSDEENYSEAYLSSSEGENEPPFKRPRTGEKPLQYSDSDSEMDSTENEIEGEIPLGEDEYMVERIVGVKTEKGKKMFHVKWLNYDSSENTWEPEENLENCKDMIDQFFQDRVSSSSHQRKRRPSKSQVQKCAKPSQRGRTKPKRCRRNPARKVPTISVVNEAVRKMSNYARVPVVEKEDDVTSSSSSTIPSSSSSPSSSSWHSSTSPVPLTSPSASQSSSSVVLLTSPTPSPNLPEQSELWSLDLDDLILPVPTQDMIPKHLRNNHLFYFRVVSGQKLDYIYIDLLESIPMFPQAEEYYECIITEDIAGKNLKYILGATRAFSGDIFCLVQFEGYNYVDVVLSEVLLERFPSFRRFFEVSCPELFPPTS